MKMQVHAIIENATRALKRYDSHDEHWKVLLSLLRYNAKEFIEHTVLNTDGYKWDAETRKIANRYWS